MEDPDALEKRAMKATKPMLGESKHKLSWIWMAAAQGVLRPHLFFPLITVRYG
jgi:hypothetical protein